MISRCDSENQSLYIQVSRGVAPREFGLPQNIKQTVLMMASPLIAPAHEQIEEGVAAVTATDIRWLRCNIKSTSLLGNNMLRQLALDEGALECVLLRDGFVTEGAASNIFLVRD